MAWSKRKRGRRPRRQMAWLPTAFSEGPASGGQNFVFVSEPTACGSTHASFTDIVLFQEQTPPATSGGLGPTTSSSIAALSMALEDLRVERIVGRVVVAVQRKRNPDDGTGMARAYAPGGVIPADDVKSDIVRISVGFRRVVLDPDGATDRESLALNNVNLVTQMSDTMARLFHVEQAYFAPQTPNNVGQINVTPQLITSLDGLVMGRPDLFKVDISPKLTVKKGQALVCEVGLMNIGSSAVVPFISNPNNYLFYPDLRVLVSRARRF